MALRPAQTGLDAVQLTLQWALLLALATLAGQWVQRASGLPRVFGYAAVGLLAGLGGLVQAHWPLAGLGLFLLELGIAVVLFEAGARLPLRWFRHNPLVLVQSLAEAVLTFAAAFVVLRTLGLDVKVVRALATIAVAASPAVLMRVVGDLRAGGPITDRAIILATLNTLYALTLGAVLLFGIDRGESSMLASMGQSLGLLGRSALLGTALAVLLLVALRLLRSSHADAAIVVLAAVAACVAAARPLGATAPAAALLGGLLLRQLHPRPWIWPQQLGTAATIVNTIMFVLVSALAVQADWSLTAVAAALTLVVVRAAAKLASLPLAGLGTGLSLRQNLWVGATQMPMSSVALLLTSQFASAAPNVGAQVAAIALPTILLTELLGAASVSLALVRSGEATAPGRRAPPTPSDAEHRP